MCEEPTDLDLETGAATGDFWSMLNECIEEAGGDGESTCEILRNYNFEDAIRLLAVNGIRPVFDHDKNRDTKQPLYDDDDDTT